MACDRSSGGAGTSGTDVIINIHWDGGWMQPTYAAQAAVNLRLTQITPAALRAFPRTQPGIGS
jgi:hypothetical protein